MAVKSGRENASRDFKKELNERPEKSQSSAQRTMHESKIEERHPFMKEMTDVDCKFRLRLRLGLRSSPPRPGSKLGLVISLWNP